MRSAWRLGELELSVQKEAAGSESWLTVPGAIARSEPVEWGACSSGAPPPPPRLSATLFPQVTARKRRLLLSASGCAANNGATLLFWPRKSS